MLWEQQYAQHAGNCNQCDGGNLLFAEETAAEEEAVEAPEEAPVVEEEEVIEEIVVEEVPAENEVVADETDFVQE